LLTARFPDKKNAASIAQPAVGLETRRMKYGCLILAGTLLLCTAPAASAATVSGSTALALAGVVAPLSPLLASAEKQAMAMLFAANSEIPYRKKIVVAADKIVCRTGNVDITARSCEVTFGKKVRTVNGPAANEIFATAALAGVPSDGAAGSVFESLSKLSCTIDPQAIRQKDGSGADCSFQPGS
jgi:hypothetical protein